MDDVFRRNAYDSWRIEAQTLKATELLVGTSCHPRRKVVLELDFSKDEELQLPPCLVMPICGNSCMMCSSYEKEKDLVVKWAAYFAS